jgi:tetratricopeptide (TPR) repeat protein
LEHREIDKAEQLFEQTLGNTMLRAAASRTVVAGAKIGMALIASKQKDYETAAALTGEAILTLESETDSDMLNLANGCNNLGAMLAKQGQFDEAQAKYERALELCRAILPASHPLRESRKQSWFLFFRRGLYGQSLPMIHGSISRLAKALGRENPHTQQAARNYVDCVEELKKRNIAVVFQEESRTGNTKRRLIATRLAWSSFPPRQRGVMTNRIEIGNR